MLNEKQIKELQQALLEAQNPLFFFDDDPDGLSSFLLLYRKHREGKGIVVKSVPFLDEKFVPFVERHNPDTLFVLDMPNITQEFIDAVKKPLYWIDHHGPKERENVHYYNPRAMSQHANIPTTYMAYQVAQQDMWIAMVGCLGDWYVPPFLKEFAEQYPDLIDMKLKGAPALLFGTKIGKLVRIFSFILKGNQQGVNQCYKILTRIKDPYEILHQTTAQGKFIYKHYKKVNDHYEKILKDVLTQDMKDDLLLYRYGHERMSFTSDLSNELLYRFPKKLIIIAREKSGEMRMSIRNAGKKHIPPMLEKALQGLEGHGGGHEHACGAAVKVEDFDLFLERMRKEL